MNDQADLPRAIGRMYAAAIVAICDEECGPEALPRVLRACMDVLPVDGVVVSLMNDACLPVMSYASDDVAAQLESAQVSLGEGPCIEAFTTHRPVLTPDLSDTTAPSWPVFATEMNARRIGAIFAFPLRVGRTGVGAIGFYCRRPRPLSDDELALALEVTGLVTVVLLHELRLAQGSRRGVLGSGHEELHQAIGVLIATFGMSVEEALARLRGYAFVAGRSVDAVAHAVVTSELSPAVFD